MIQVTKCPFRISLAGGSTDLQEYLEQYGEGAVISFTPNLFTYIIMKKSSDNHYKIIYSNVEKVAKTEDIKNDIETSPNLYTEWFKIIFQKFDHYLEENKN